MKTQILTYETDTAAALLRAGGLAAVPTETVYGLAGNGLDPDVIERIYEVKGRPAVKPISLMVPDAGAIGRLSPEAPPAAYTLAERFWPGPLTLVLPAAEHIPPILRAGGSTVGLRCPQQEETLKLLRALDFPLAVPSANPSGETSPKTAEQVLAYFDGKIEAVIDGGPCTLGVESTLIDLSRVPYRVLRRGALAEEEIADALAEKMTLIGITGGSGSGKTSVLKLLEARGASVIDADAVYHELLESSGALLAELKEAFPQAVTEKGLDRGALGKLVFSDAAALRKLNGISHRYIGLRIRELLREHAMRGGRLAALDAIELFGPGTEGLRFDLTLAVTASEETRTQRIMKRDGISREAALQRIRAQHSDDCFREKCDVAVRNDGDMGELEQEIRMIMEEKLKWKT
ncbi:MAG: threonylcarbamoyl-AMP synthase [Oscillospiraceae bacterium]|nr:threonylcarbamoyl-AMP synthase [Oscillospiraceae bacterium]